MFARVIIAYLVFTQQIEHRFYDTGHFVLRDALIAVDIVHGEGPLKLLVRAAVQGDIDGAHEALKVDGMRPFIRIKGAKDVVAEFLRFPIRIAILIHFDELLLVQEARRAVRQESVPPVEYFLLAEFRLRQKIVDNRVRKVRCRLAVQSRQTGRWSTLDVLRLC